MSGEEIDQWSRGIEAKIEEADEKIEILQGWIANKRVMRESKEKEERMQFEIKLHETKLKLQEVLRAKTDSHDKGSSEQPISQAKLPKLVITKFDGSYMDWMRFWGEYSETIDKTNIAPVTKFTFLRELLCEKAKKTIEALPHTAEGYNRALSLLKDRFGKESEIIKAYVKAILDLPHVPTANARKIHDFYEKLAYNVVFGNVKPITSR